MKVAKLLLSSSLGLLGPFVVVVIRVTVVGGTVPFVAVILLSIMIVLD